MKNIRGILGLVAVIGLAGGILLEMDTMIVIGGLALAGVFVLDRFDD